ncbi:SET domain group 40 isoform X2 [Tasmannia lanceolata]|uniref:SET domain group 40 isoform X2 n=1 Tax=Tasmannia lanceolata TaxID=3420 RepID=UPI004062EB9F
MGEEEKLEAFLKWATELGISDSPNPLHPSSSLGQSLLLSQFPNAGGRGLAAARELRKGELILRVPKSALMTRENLLKDQKLKVFVNKYPHLSSTQVLAVCLLAEVGKGRDSWWHPYLMQLPHTYDILASFTQFEIQALQVDDAIWESEKAISKAQSDWKEAKVLMQEIGLRPQLLTFRSWLWASATISSRTLHIPWDDAGCLCPVGDFFNYAAPTEESFCSEDVKRMAETSSSQEKFDVEQLCGHSPRLTDAGYEKDVASYCFYARTNYSKGEQVLLCYSTYTNLELLEHYGFLLDTNPNDKAFIQLDVGIHSCNSWPKDSLYLQQDGRPSFALHSALRLWAIPPNLRRSIGHLAYSGSLLSVDNEISVMNWLAKTCREFLGKMPTSIEEDYILLHIIDKMQSHPSSEEAAQILSCEGELHSFLQVNGLRNGVSAYFMLPRKAQRSMERWKLAVQWRLMYKKILSDCISYCAEISNNLSSHNVSSRRKNQN